MIVRQFLAAAIGCILLAGSANAQDLQQQDLFARGQNGYHTFRIPSLLSTKSGTLLAVCEGRKNSASDAGDIDIVMKRSTDHGKTWSAQTVIWNDDANTCGNPCPVVDRETGTIWLLMTRNLGGDHERDIHLGKSNGTRTVWISRSDDDGATWSQPLEITSSTKLPSWRWYATGPGVGIQLEHGTHKGRLVIPCDHSIVENETNVISRSHVIYSDDHGTNWHVGGILGGGMNECQVVELADTNASLLISMRNHPKGSNRAQSLSSDGGESWTMVSRHSQLIDPTCQASILRGTWPAEKQPSRILFSNPASERRRNMTVRVSYDEGKTWPTQKVLWEKDSAYSCLAVIRNGEIGCLYERGEKNAYEKITFAQFPLSWLEGK